MAEISFEQSKKILNSGEDQYTDEQIKYMMGIIQMWARINAKVIIKYLENLNNVDQNI